MGGQGRGKLCTTLPEKLSNKVMTNPITRNKIRILEETGSTYLWYIILIKEEEEP